MNSAYEGRTGSHVIFVDEVGKEHDALVTADWGYGKTENPSINLVFVTDDTSMNDPYGLQMVRKTSVVHESNQAAPGFFWREA